MQIGIVTPQQDLGTDPVSIRRWAETVESCGFDFIDIFDHVLGADISDRPGWPGPYTHHHPFHEPFTLLAHLAAVVDIDLATGVIILPQRQTALVAKQAAQLDLLSGGRFRLGVGIGWNPVESQAMGADFATRARRYDDQLVVLRRLWNEEIVDHTDDHHRIDRAGLAPRPTRSIPLWLGGGTAPAVLSRVARVADGWIVHQPRAGAELLAALETVRRAATAAGRDPADIGVQGRIDIHGAIDEERFHRAVDAWMRASVTHLAIHATGQGGIDAHFELLPRLAALVGEHTD